MNATATLPRVSVLLDGRALDQRHAGALCEVRVRQALSVPAQCELVFRDPPGPLATVAAVRPGARLDVAVDGHATALFRGDISAVEHAFVPGTGHEVRLRAYDASHRLRRRQTVRAHVQVTPAALAAELAREVGLTVRAGADGPRHEWLVQHRASDLELLVDALARCGQFYAVRDDRLHLLTLAGLGQPLELGDSVLEWRLERNVDATCGEVAVAGWDPLRAETHVSRASGPAPGGLRSLCDQSARGQQHADALARAELDARTSGAVRLWAVAEGRPDLRPGAIVVLDAAGEPGARHVLTVVTHTIDDRRGYVSAIETEPPRPPVRPTAAAMTEAIVTQVRDPEQRGRVKARLPGYFDVETDWMPVVTLGAGSGKGLLVQPDVDDTVLVLLAHGDPAEGVVLGGLYGQRDVPDAGGVVGGAVRQYQLRTPGGQVVQLDDERGGVVVRDRGGSSVELGPQRVRLHAAADLEIEAPGRRIVIRGRAIDFESA